MRDLILRDQILQAKSCDEVLRRSAGPPYRLTSRRMIRRITAPMKALMICGDDAAADHDADARQEPAGNQAADDADDDVADQAEAAAFDHHPGEPAGDSADDQPNNNASASIIPPECPLAAPAVLGAPGAPCPHDHKTLRPVCQHYA